MADDFYTFPPETTSTYANGSATVGKVAASVQTISLTGTGTAGSLSASFDDNAASIAYNATTADAASALNALGSITAAGGVTVTGTAGSSYVVTFNKNGPRSALVIDDSGLTGATAAVAQTTAGIAAVKVCSVAPGNGGALIQNTGSTAVFLGGPDVAASGDDVGISLAADATLTAPASGGLAQNLYAAAAADGGSVTFLYPA